MDSTKNNTTLNQASSMWIKHSLRLLHHELRRGELTIIFLAIVLAVATVFSLSGFSGQIKQAILANSTNTIAADRVLRSNRTIDVAVLEKASTEELKVAEKIEMASMAFFKDEMLLSEISAVSNAYPLRGQLKVKSTVEQPEAVVSAVPAPGSVLVEASILSRLNVSVGDTIEIGVAELKIEGIVTHIPDRSYRAFIAGPSIIMNIADVPSTELIQPGSRATYKYLFAGEQAQVESFEKWIKPQLNDAQRWYDAKMAQNRLSRILDSAEKFLSLASMLGIVLAAVAVAVASRRYGQRHKPTVSVFKALGASTKHIRNLYLLHWTLLSAISITVGLVLGYILMALGLNIIQDYLSLENANVTAQPFIIAVVTGILCAVAFAVHPLKHLIETSPLSVIRGFSSETLTRFGFHQLLPMVGLFLLLYIFSQDLKLSLSLLVGGALVSVVLLVIGRLIMSAGRSVGSKAGKSWYLALANLKRRASENSVQLVSFTIAIQLLLLITVMKNSMLSEWEAQFPEDTPDHYLINIAESEVPALESFVQQENIATQGFYWIYRGRLSAINGEQTVRDRDDHSGEDEDVKEGSEEETSRGREGMGRELGLTWRDEVPEGNIVKEGTWWQIEDESPQVSIESNVAERLKISLGDELTFDIGSDSFTVPVTSIREVDWQSRQLNFIMVFNQAALKGLDTTAISAWKVDEQDKSKIYRFLSQYPTISIMDFGAIMEQLNTMIEQVSIAIELILILVVLAGSLVLIAQVQASMEERERELAILRTLGAKGSLLRNSVLFEFVALGAIAGLMASLAMEIGVYILQTQVFKMDPSFHFSYWFVGVSAGAIFVGLIGMLSCWRLLNLSSVTLIRRTM